MSSGFVNRLIGSPVRRVEDGRLLTGRGRFVDDVQLPRMSHAAFLRSYLAHGRIASIDVTEALELPGVVAVYTAADLEGHALPLDFTLGIEGHRPPVHEALCRDKVRYVGDPVAMVVAETRHLAEDAAERIQLQLEELPAVVSVADALAVGAPLVFDELGDNVVHRDSYSYGDVEGTFAGADRVISETFEQHRFGLVSMEGRGCIAHHEPVSGELTFWASTQSTHMLRSRLSEILGHPFHRVRVLAGDVGGAFGGKGAIYREDVAVAVASKLTGRPVKWIEDRAENLTAMGSAREDTLRVDAAVSDAGTILALRIAMTMNHGAYPGMWPTPIFAALCRCTVLSALRVPTFAFETTIVATNKNTYVSYRGPGASETLVRERMLDVIANELGLDPVEVRRRNLLRQEEQPWRMPTGATVDRQCALETLERAVDVVCYDAFREEQHEARAAGRLLGIGFATSIQPCPAFPDWWESIGYPSERSPARVRLEPDGHVTVITSEMPHGQGHETTLAQVAADELGVAFEDVRVVLGDTQATPFYYFGTGASRGAPIGAATVLASSRELKSRVLELASHVLEVGVDDLELRDGAVSALGAPMRSVTLAALARRAYRSPETLPPEASPDLDVLRYLEPDEAAGGWTSMTHVCVAEVDPLTGVVSIPRYLVVEHCGQMINPALVEGQIRGGVAQGIGGVLYEHAAYDEEGQFLAGTFQTYLIPSADGLPEVEIHHLELPSDTDGDFRGVGEGGAITAPAALANAIEDALAPLGIRITRLPLSPTRMLELMGVIPVDTDLVLR